MPRSWDVFCEVVDNYGDAAVSWRLALQLANEQSGRVRLWIDELRALGALCPQIDPNATRQAVNGVQVCKWTAEADFGVPADIAIEAFGCGLPERYTDAMVGRASRPVWIILEYLSAEGWIGGHHGLPSPHPRLPLERYFFFPGFTPSTGGLLHEAQLEQRRADFQRSPDKVDRFWRNIGFAPVPVSADTVSLFGYENYAASRFLQIWSQALGPSVVAVPPSPLRAQVCAFFNVADPGDGQTLGRGALEVRLIPFLPQSTYDELLWACDWNFVRGEDSFVRAQWARRPFVWQIYRQAEDAHRLKLGAFLDLYCQGLDPALGGALRHVWHTWNGLVPAGVDTLATDWEALTQAKAPLGGHCVQWADRVAATGDLAANLAQFCEERLK